MEKIGIIGLGYVGLPLAVEFGKVVDVVGFDIDKGRIGELEKGHDRTHEVDTDQLKEAVKLAYSSDMKDLKEANYYIVTVPTPVDEFKKPDLRPVESASRTVGKVLRKGDIVIYESTVYPGCTEEVCVPLLESESGLKFNKDFYCGYSPERINPGDRQHRVTTIKKVTSGSTPEIAEKVDRLYKKIIKAGTHKASSIKVAEAAKVIENSQRDLNIAFVNELALIFEKVGIDTHEVLEAAGTKWNFLPFKPGLVGGHCIGVDPYYLTYKAEGLGYRPEVILSGRRINDNMPVYIANAVIKLMAKNDLPINKSRILVLGVTFKEDCPDIRNSKVADVVKELQTYGALVD
ncbi:MAG TPA: nucleotide sugar dehydrogenase, partial [Cyclobacteriaceae bacterium]|nr:nucleotide sugar dehydrogenase [Cyclobacteriaceae bacterium]